MLMVQLAHAVTAPAPAPSGGHSSRLGLILFGIFALLIGAVNSLKPDLSWRLSRWQYRNPDALQPSRAGLLAVRLGGVLALVIGVVAIIVAIVK